MEGIPENDRTSVVGEAEEGRQIGPARSPSLRRAALKG